MTVITRQSIPIPLYRNIVLQNPRHSCYMWNEYSEILNVICRQRTPNLSALKDFYKAKRAATAAPMERIVLEAELFSEMIASAAGLLAELALRSPVRSPFG